MNSIHTTPNRFLLLMLVAVLALPLCAGEATERPASETTEAQKDLSFFEAARKNASDKTKAAWKEMKKTPRGLFFAGYYDKAIAQLKRSDKPEDLALLADILVETGRDETAVKLLTVALDTVGGNPELLAARGDAYIVSGQYDKALADYQAALKDLGEKPEPGQMRAKLSLSMLYELLCRRDAKFNETNWFFDYYMQFESDDKMSAEEALHIGRGAIVGEDFQNGFGVMVLAQRKDPTYVPAFVAAGDVFSLKYQYPDAEGEYASALALNPRSVGAHVGLSGLYAFKRDFEQADKHAKLALKINPRSVEARLTLAALDYIDEQYEEAIQEIDTALSVNPNHPDALLFKTALHHLVGDDEGYETSRRQLMAVYDMLPGASDMTRAQGLSRLQTEVSQVLGSAHHVEEALEWARKAVETDAENPAAHARLAISLMRNGLEDEAKGVLDDAFQLDMYNVWIFNLRKLQERDEEYRRLATDRFEVKLFKEDEPILADEIQHMVDEQIAHCEELFGFKVPKETIKLSIMKSHTDFSARVTGLPHLDASGATFGPFVALVSPADFKRRGRFFNWRSVSLHEIAHVVTLMGSDYRIPRWLTEGMSVYAEGWITHEWDIPFKTMVEMEMLPDFRTWNRDFHRPEYGWQVPAAYHAAGATVGWFVEEYGKEILPKLVKLYGEGKSTEEVLKEATGKDIDTLNAWLHDKLRERARHIQCMIMEDPAQQEALEKRVAENPDDLPAQLKLFRIYRMTNPEKAFDYAETIGEKLQAMQADGLTPEYRRMAARGLSAIGALYAGHNKPEDAKMHFDLAASIDPEYGPAHQFLARMAETDKDLETAETHYRKAIEAYPRMTFDDDNGNPYAGLSRILSDADRNEELVGLLESYWQVRRDDPGPVRKLATSYETLGQPEKAMDAYRRLFAIDPYVQTDREAYAALLDATGQAEEAERQRAIAKACPDTKTGRGTDEAKTETGKAAETAETTTPPDSSKEAKTPATEEDVTEDDEPETPEEATDIDPKLKGILDEL